MIWHILNSMSKSLLTTNVLNTVGIYTAISYLSAHPPSLPFYNVWSAMPGKLLLNLWENAWTVYVVSNLYLLIMYVYFWKLQIWVVISEIDIFTLKLKTMQSFTVGIKLVQIFGKFIFCRRTYCTFPYSMR